MAPLQSMLDMLSSMPSIASATASISMAAATTTRLANTSSIPRSIMWSAFDYSIIASVDFCLLMRSMLCRSCSHSDRAKHSKCGNDEFYGACCCKEKLYCLHKD
ncbi:uncharacterized protein [Lolium perenne]|uniref:uncharacterized protein n=1 Tax=Lolium perenne TaxID=4522 RepID=UPI0021F63433|nr:uncharacterized protein LOC127307219 [Lolium perenne]